jgi:hypothetical protein
MRKAVIEVADKWCRNCPQKWGCPYSSDSAGNPRRRVFRNHRPVKACRDATLAYSVTWGGVRKGKIKGNLKP